MARVLIADTLAKQGIEMLSKEHDVEVKTGLSEDALIEAVAGVQALVVRSQTQVTERVIAAATSLEVIGRAGVGVDNIDVEAATRHGVIVVNAPLANTLSTAEHAFGLMLATARNIPQGHASLQAGRWDRNKYMGVELAGKTLGVVGLGRIGTEVANRARAFQMRIVAYDPFVSPERAATLGVELMDLDGVLAESDFVTLHALLHEGTRNLINAERLAKAKPGIRIINAARGALIDEQALFDAVESGQVAGAGLDVFSEEPAVGNILTTSDKIVVTPHLAASTGEAQDRAAVDTAEQVLDVLAGRSARFAVNAPLVDPETMAIIGPYLDAADLAGRLAAQLAGGPVQQVRVQLLGEIGTHEPGPLRTAVIGGLLARVSDAKVTVVNADQLAEQAGLRLEIESGPARDPYTSLVVVQAAMADGVRSVAATHTSNGVRVVGIDDYTVEISPNAAPHAVMVENVDRPGMIGRVGGLLGGNNVNIAYMSVGAGNGERALMVLGTDRELNEQEIGELTAFENVFSARQLDLE
ncbi:MAG: phosphoglycerate dehydrogenase [Chloroflexi bacterium]|nr:MAG: phosphoglycerate dehydrogenase [Chloroflexota bacterium]